MTVPPPNPTKIFHITSIDNLESILQSGGVLCKNLLTQQDINHQSIAHQNIQDRRASTIVPIGNGGNLHDYVPFSFAPRSPMLDTIRRGNVSGYSSGQENICHLVTTAQNINSGEVNYAFTNGHAIMLPVDFFNSLDHLNQVDWEIFFEPPLIPPMGGYSKYWQDNYRNPNKPKWMDRARRRQAEFLVYQRLAWQFINEVAVINQEKATIVKNLFNNFNIQTIVTVKPEYYFLDNQ